MDADQLRRFVIRPTLRHIGLWSSEAEALILGTAAQESALGQYVRQISGGPARGIYQMEPATHDDIWRNYLRYRGDIATRINELRPQWPANHEALVTSLAYATAMTRVHYLRVPEALPEATDLQGMARYYKRYYNTPAGHGTEQQFVRSWCEYIGRVV